MVVHLYLRYNYISHSKDRPFLLGSLPDLSFFEMGVDVFFVISGFIMIYISEAGRNTGRRLFLLKRGLRIYPPYWIYSGVMMLTLTILLPRDHRLDFELMGFVRTMGLYPTYNEVSNSIFPRFLDQGWTLMYELLFYAIFAVFIGRSTGVKVIGTSLVLVAFHLFAVWTDVLPRAVNWMLSDSILLEFIIGMGLGWLYLKRSPKLGTLVCLILSAVALAWWVYFQTQPYEGWGDRIISYAMPLAILFGVTLFWKGGAAVKLPKITKVLGDASYSIYLTHTIAIIVFAWLNRPGHILENVNLDLQFSAGLAICLAIGLSSYMYVEKPLQILFHRILKKII
ncbi:acyltransferase [Pelagicoccus albus]|uniref:Acyltransferase n=1 Tax=Pelagicoccus albus TaxID=415222 RepID=A0A7X1B5E7_9BACT|nr:acyltransferase [Pelagicoccus albus]